MASIVTLNMSYILCSKRNVVPSGKLSTVADILDDDTKYIYHDGTTFQVGLLTEIESYMKSKYIPSAHRTHYYNGNWIFVRSALKDCVKCREEFWNGLQEYIGYRVMFLTGVPRNTAFIEGIFLGHVINKNKLSLTRFLLDIGMNPNLCKDATVYRDNVEMFNLCVEHGLQLDHNLLTLAQDVHCDKVAAYIQEHMPQAR